jgi:SMODS-associating 2TM, beta-strand rich effector domain
VPTRAWIPIVVGLAVLATVAIAWLTSIVRGESIDDATLVAVALGMGGGIAITSLALSAIDRRLWRTGLFRRLRLPEAPPVLHGTWRTSVDSRLRGRELDAFLVINQRFTGVTTLLLFPDGRSRSMVAALTRTPPHQQWELWFFYEFHPNSRNDPLGHRSGAAELDVSTQEPVLHGEFWNTLQDGGSMKSVAFDPVLFSRYDVAKAHFDAAITSRR